MPKMLLFAFLLSFSVSVANTQEPEIADIDKQIAELDKQIAELKAQGAQGNLKSFFMPVKVKQVINKEAAIVQLTTVIKGKQALGFGEYDESDKFYKTDYYAVCDTKGFVDGRVYKLALVPSGNTRTYKTVGTGSRTIEELIERDKSEIKLEEQFFECRTAAARLSFNKIIEAMKDESFFLYKLDGRKKVRAYHSKVTVLVIGIDIDRELGKKFSPLKLDIEHYRKLGRQNFNWLFKDESGKLLMNFNFHKVTARELKPFVEQARLIEEKYRLTHGESVGEQFDSDSIMKLGFRGSYRELGKKFSEWKRLPQSGLGGFFMGE